jgi:hypothetical protein
VLDNGCFSATWDMYRWIAELERHMDTPSCLLAVVPDVVADANATFERWARWWAAPLRRGYHCAYVAQDGCRFFPAGAQAPFIGGSTEWKLGPEPGPWRRWPRTRACGSTWVE